METLAVRPDEIDLLAVRLLGDKGNPLSIGRPSGRGCPCGWLSIQRKGATCLYLQKDDIQAVQVVAAPQRVHNGSAIRWGARVPMVAGGVGGQGARPAAIDIGQEQLVGIVPLNGNNQTLGVGHKSGTTRSDCKVCDPFG